jgi:hypothetical protein
MSFEKEIKMNSKGKVVPIASVVLITAAATSVLAQNRMMGSQGRNGARNVQVGERRPASSLMVNGRPASADVDPQMIGGRMMVPIRFVAEELGANVTWDPKTRTVRLLQGNEDVTMTIGSTRSMVNGEGRALAVAPVIRKGRTLLPLKDVARFIGGIADYNPETRTVFVTTPGGRGGDAQSGSAAGTSGR